MIKEYINQPYPLSENKWKLAILISLFITFFIIVFQPFGLSQGQTNLFKTLVLTGYGCVTFIILVFNLFAIPSILKKTFNNKLWTVKKQIIWLIWIIFTIGTGNFIYSIIIFRLAFGFYAFVIFQFYTLIVGILPIVVLTILKQNRMLAQNLKSANELNNQLKNNEHKNLLGQIVYLTADNDKDKLEIELSNLLYIESTGNYIQVFYLKDEKLKNMLLRSSLKRTEIQLAEFHNIFKCHRAFLVNLHKIVQVKGNSQGLKLHIKNVDTEIPVSRSLSKSLKEQINSFQ